MKSANSNAHPVAATVAIALGCAMCGSNYGDDGRTPTDSAITVVGTGGKSGTGGKAGTGGKYGTGGEVGSGGATDTGGKDGTGGKIGTGGAASTGGTVGGGATGTGGAVGKGGSPGTGGSKRDAGAPDSGTSSNPCDSPDLVWKTGSKTNYTSYPEPGSPECIDYSGCEYEGLFSACDDKRSLSWVEAHNIVAVFPDFGKLKLHDLCIKSGNKTIVATVLDQCGDSDCSGCCTENKGSADELIDIESFTNERFGVEDGPVKWADLGPTKTSGCQ